MNASGSTDFLSSSRKPDSKAAVNCVTNQSELISLLTIQKSSKNNLNDAPEMNLDLKQTSKKNKKEDRRQTEPL